MPIVKFKRWSKKCALYTGDYGDQTSGWQASHEDENIFFKQCKTQVCRQRELVNLLFGPQNDQSWPISGLTVALGALDLVMIPVKISTAWNSSRNATTSCNQTVECHSHCLCCWKVTRT